MNARTLLVIIATLAAGGRAAVAASSLDGTPLDAATLLSLCESDPGNAVCIEAAGQRAVAPRAGAWVPAEAILGTPRIENIDDFDAVMGANLPGYTGSTQQPQRVYACWTL